MLSSGARTDRVLLTAGRSTASAFLFQLAPRDHTPKLFIWFGNTTELKMMPMRTLEMIIQPYFLLFRSYGGDIMGGCMLLAGDGCVRKEWYIPITRF